MNRPKSFVIVLMVAAAVVAGAFVATLVPPVSTANAAVNLDLAPPPPASAAVAVPSFADLADRAIPSVVSITSTQMVERNPHGDMFDNPFFRRFFRGEPFGDQGNPNDQRKKNNGKEKKTWAGSGFFITRDGYILTNKHVVENAETLFVRTSQMSQQDEGIPAKQVGVDPFLDLALIKIDNGNDWPALPLGDSDKLRVGEWTVAIGNPIFFRNSVTVGVVSGKGRRIDFDPANIGDYIQTDAAINFGNSGGPLLNARGEVIGINSAIIRDDPTGNGGGMGGNGLIQGIGFALPITPVKRVLSQLASTGTVKRGYLGVSVQPMDPEKAEYLAAPKNKGAYVQRVDKDTPAAKAGMKADDIILSVDGSPVGSSEELVNAISSHAPGETVKLMVWRDKKEQPVSVTLGERPVGRNEQEQEQGGGSAKPDENDNATALGFSVGPIPPGMRDKLQQGDTPVKGVLITDVDPASQAASRGVAAGMVLVDINGQATPSVDAYRKVTASIKPNQIVRARIMDGTGDEVTVFFRAPGAAKK